MTDLLDFLLTASPEPVAVDLSSWRAHHDRAHGTPLEAAVRGGFAADRLGLAFASGYQAACRRLLPDAPDGWLLALCATEAGGNHPRAIATRLSEGVLTGEKRFVSMGTEARGLLVVATEGVGEDGRSRLKVALVDAEAPGVTVTAGPPLPFIPEIPHAVLALDGAAPVRVLPGDGYAGYLKPFRTIEDIHVFAALLGHLVGLSRRSGMAPEVTEALVAAVCTLAPLSTADPSHPAVHRALGGALARAEALIGSLELSGVEAAVRQRWARDSPLLQIASRTRHARLKAARLKVP